MGMRRKLLVVVLTVLLADAARSEACNVPVFRYALENWRPDPYEAILFHEGPLTSELQGVVNALGKANANLLVRTVDVSTAGAEPMQLWQQQKSGSLPWLVVRYPRKVPVETPVWAGPPSAAAIDALVQSPARQTIASRLLQGESIVFVVIDSGDARTDAEWTEMLDRELARLTREVKLPADSKSEAKPGSGQENIQLASDLPLRIAFSTVRIARTDPAEKMFLSILLSADPELARTKEPVLFPVYGRGRALGGFIGAEVTPEMLEGASKFLCAPCSCDIKGGNTGTDLLIRADWNSIFKDGIPPPPAVPGAPVSIPQPRSKLPAESPTPPVAPASSEPPACMACRVGTVSLAVAGFLGLAAAAWLVRSRLNRSEPIA